MSLSHKMLHVFRAHVRLIDNQMHRRLFPSDAAALKYSPQKENGHLFVTHAVALGTQRENEYLC